MRPLVDSIVECFVVTDLLIQGHVSHPPFHPSLPSLSSLVPTPARPPSRRLPSELLFIDSGFFGKLVFSSPRSSFFLASSFLLLR